MARLKIGRKNKICIMGGCDDWAIAVDSGKGFYGCGDCGFNYGEDERRKGLPFKLDENGKWRRIVSDYED